MENNNKFNCELVESLIYRIIKNNPYINENKIISINNTINNDNKVPLWLKSKVYESVLNTYGLFQYLYDLNNYDGKNPEKEVGVNIYLSSALISNSMNQYMLLILDELIKKKKILLFDEQYEEIKKYFDPNKMYDVDYSEIKIDSFILEEIKNEILKYTLDNITNLKNKKIGIEKNIDNMDIILMNIIPYDLTYLKKLNIDVNKIISLSLKYKNLKILVKDGYIIWKYGNEPTIYIKNNELFYSPTMSNPEKKTNKNQALKQSFIITKELENLSSEVICKICNKNKTSDLVWDTQYGIIPVCKDCMKNPSIIGIVGKITPKKS